MPSDIKLPSDADKDRDIGCDSGSVVGSWDTDTSSLKTALSSICSSIGSSAGAVRVVGVFGVVGVVG